MADKRILWAINLYSRVNHLRVQEELIRRRYGDFFYISVHTGNELFDTFPDSSFRYKEDKLTRVPDDPSVHTRYGSTHGGSHNGDRDIYNRVAADLEGFDYMIMTAADAIFSDYASVEIVMDRMISGGHAFMSCTRKTGTGRGSGGPYVDNEFWAIEVDFYRRIFPMDMELEGYCDDGSLTLPMERGLGELVHRGLDGDDGGWLVIPGRRHDGSENNMELDDGLGRICTENRFSRTRDYMAKYCPDEYEHVMKTCFPGGLLYDVRPNYDV